MPINLTVDEPRKNNVRSSNHHVLWITLDNNNPKVYELVHQNGEPLSDEERISGNEQVSEQDKLLPHILEAVSGEKYVQKMKKSFK